MFTKQKFYKHVMFTNQKQSDEFTDKLCLQNKFTNTLCLQNNNLHVIITKQNNTKQKYYKTRFVYKIKHLHTSYVYKTK